MRVSFRVNEDPVAVAPRLYLADCLRDALGVTGPFLGGNASRHRLDFSILAFCRTPGRYSLPRKSTKHWPEITTRTLKVRKLGPAGDNGCYVNAEGGAPTD